MAQTSFYKLKGKRIFLAGHGGLLGSAIHKRLQQEGSLVLCASRLELDLNRQYEVEHWIRENRPDGVIIAAGKVGGISANERYPAEFIYQNLVMAGNLIHAAHLANVEKLIFLGSSCSYPKFTPQPIPESALLDGKPEPTSQWYTIAKIAGIKLCEAYRKQYGQNFISVIPANLYGPGDNFDGSNSHIIPGLIQRFHEAKLLRKPQVAIWGTGTPLREFLYVDDASDAIVFLMQHYSDNDVINVGTGHGITVMQVAELIAKVVGYQGELVTDTSKTDGTPYKVLDVSKLFSMGWQPKTELAYGLELTYKWFQSRLS